MMKLRSYAVFFLYFGIAYSVLAQEPICESGDCINGFGKLINGSSWTYEGSFVNGRREGQGKITIKRSYSVEIYEGGWSNNERHGYGEVEYESGNTYKGYWSNGQISGKGKYEDHENMTSYDGEWVRGKRNGMGVQRYRDGSVYEGTWKNDKEDGKGILKMINGDIYEGNFVLGKKHGKGAYTYGAGSIFAGDRVEGSFENNQKNGTCIYYFRKGGKLIGQFQYDRLNGYGIEYDASGSVVKCGVWQGGIFVEDRSLSSVEPYLSIQKNSTIHVIVFSDRDDPQIGISAEKASEYFERIFIPVLRDHSQMDVNFIHRAGRDQFTLNEINTVLAALPTANDDVIFFYYVGHGFNNGFSELPTLQMGRKTDPVSLRSKNLSEVYETLRYKPHRLLLCLAEACNKESVEENLSSKDWGKPGNFVGYEWEPSRIQDLFKNGSGNYIMCSSKRGQLSYTITGMHGFFTNAFMATFGEAIKKGSSLSPNWPVLFDRIASKTTANALSAGEEQHPYWKQH